MIDLNTQCDFLLPGGALPVSNRDTILPRIRALMAWCRREQVPIVSSLEAHRASEPSRGLPPVCIDRTRGQRKVPFTLMPRRLFVQGDNTFDLPADPFSKYQQIIFTKRHSDFLSNPKADRLVNALRPTYWMIIGIAATHAVKSIALGLLARSQRVVVVKDCCGYWSNSDSEHAMRQMDAKGALIVESEEIISGYVASKLSQDIEEEAARIAEKEGIQEPATVSRMRMLRSSRKAVSAADADQEPGAAKQRSKAKSGPEPASDDLAPHELVARKRTANGKTGRPLA
ncbi:MAG TPA: isochorismatase family protein [Phycisphaerae bacterium]|nr:isochorismatase family protein [Phycisphaerae bacterium]HRW52081.1 isochorismatase family protein [Phycisphaerae bacterium]